MITFLSSPKPFKGISKVNQYRAIQNLLAVAEGVEVILYGDSDGIDEAGQDLGVKVIKQIACAPSGIPYFASIINHAAEYGKYDLQVYLNCDILLTGIMDALNQIKFSNYLLVGQRIDLAEGMFIDFEQIDWLEKLRRLADDDKAKLFSPFGIDYFAFRRGLWKNLPPIVIGRAGYDNALLAYCLLHKIPIIDATFSVVALHQFHDYVHIDGGKKEVWHGIDALNNIHHAGRHSLASISDSSYVLSGSNIQFCPCRGDWLRRFELTVRYRLGLKNLSFGVRLLSRLLQLIDFPHVVVLSLSEVMDSYPPAITGNIGSKLTHDYSH